MGVLIEIPSALKQFAKNQDQVEVLGNSIEEAFTNLCSEYTDLRQNLYDENGKIRSFINIYLNDNDIRYKDGMKSTIKNGDSIQIVPSIAGGYKN
tara:strand:- start:1522 stop:1806 length:285 start_codon:yes stop_codon:yes gene_type:complete